MNVLIAFGTTEGQTRKIARHMAQSMQDAGHSVELHDCSGRAASPSVGDFDVVVLAASVHHRRYQTAFYSFVQSNLTALQSKPVAFVSVSLSVTLASGEAEAREYVDDFISETGLSPAAVHLAEGAVRYFQYGSSEELTIDLLVFKGQKKMPKRESNPEYTDWQALDAFAASFLEDAGKS
jgi:menaquinone-dependent protoporphyrinogen oxidase